MDDAYVVGDAHKKKARKRKKKRDREKLERALEANGHHEGEGQEREGQVAGGDASNVRTTDRRDHLCLRNSPLTENVRLRRPVGSRKSARTSTRASCSSR